MSGAVVLGRVCWEGGCFLAGGVKWLQKFFGEKTLKLVDTSEIVLVVGANGGVGKRVVSKLIKQDYQVRGLVRDAKKAKKILGDKVETVTADITKPETLTPEIFKNVTRVICYTGTRVQPAAGDTSKREKYYQGVKFFMPEVAEEPQIVEYEGMKNLVVAGFVAQKIIIG